MNLSTEGSSRVMVPEFGFDSFTPFKKIRL
jgi:hypothetical protein